MNCMNDTQRVVLNVGCGHKNIKMPDHYAQWKQVRLDIDPRTEPDILLDARKLESLPPNTFDGVFSSHNLEHFRRHEAERIIGGMHHVLKDDGFAEILVPDMNSVFRTVVEKDLDIDDELYRMGFGPILVRDVLYGYSLEVETRDNDYFSHKTGFTAKSLLKIFTANNFRRVFYYSQDFTIRSLVFKQEPNAFHRSFFNLP